MYIIKCFRRKYNLKLSILAVILCFPFSQAKAGGKEELQKLVDNLKAQYPLKIKEIYQAAIADHFRMLIHDHTQVSGFAVKRLNSAKDSINIFRNYLSSYQI